MKVEKTHIIIPKKKAVPIEVGQKLSDGRTIEKIDVTDNATWITITDGKTSTAYGAKIFLDKFNL